MNIPAKQNQELTNKGAQEITTDKSGSQTLQETSQYPANPQRKRSLVGVFVILGYALLVLVPSTFAFVYYYFVASDIYVSEMRLVVKSTESSHSPSALGGIMGALGRGAGSQDLNMVAEYVHSNDLLEKLSHSVPIRTIYSNSNIDSYARLPTDASQEDLKKYFEDFVIVSDDGTGTLEVQVKAFTPEEATLIAMEITRLSEEMVDQVSDRAKHDSIKFAEKELEKAKNKYLESAKRLADFRSSSQFVDPNVNAAAIMAQVSKLEAQIAQARTEMAEMRSYLADTSPQIVAIKSKIAALEVEKQRELKRLGNSSASDMSAQLEAFEELQLLVEVNKKVYEDTLITLDAVRNEASRQSVYLVPFVPPSFPEEPTEPIRWKEVLSIFIGLSIIYGLCLLIISAIHEHVRT
ncbi:hypothetical protein [Sneathiella limimaris]|uniref:hypothetical protein n=1 Tax=Sneathiella limimaris TaxID=1964213 RepID=UPI00146E8150|nr:hypothetical protein [Sneathiella limimaris]